MIGSHPGGISLTKRLLALGGLEPPGKVLDLGAGRGESVRYLQEWGYEAKGVDLSYGDQIYGDQMGGQVSGEGEGYGRFLGESAQGGPLGIAEGPGLFFGDMRSLSELDGSFDVCLAECSVSVCGDGPSALREAFRVLRPGGSLLLSDVFFQKENAPALSMPGPLGLSCWERAWSETGVELKKLVDETPLWREFYLESLWNGNADPSCLGFFREAGKAGCGYFLAWLQKGGNYGTI